MTRSHGGRPQYAPSQTENPRSSSSHLPGLAVIALGVIAGFALARGMRNKRHQNHAVLAPRANTKLRDVAPSGDEIEDILQDAGLPETLIDSIASGAWAAADIPPIATSEQYHAYATALVGLEQASELSSGDIATAATRISAAFLERMSEWEHTQGNNAGID